jgi:hypothetical protein
MTCWRRDYGKGACSMTISEDSMNRLIREAFGELCSE